MNTFDRTNFINSLNNIINKYVSDHDLFNGGCCYSAYALAKVLAKAGINYRVKMFQYRDVLRTNQFSTAINGSGVAHVAIAVRIGRTWKTIGSCDGIYNHFNCTGETYKVWSYDNITPEQLLAGYEENEWNYMYDTEYNRSLVKDINRIAGKYSAKTKIKVVVKKRDFLSDFLNFFFVLV